MKYIIILFIYLVTSLLAPMSAYAARTSVAPAKHSAKQNVKDNSSNSNKKIYIKHARNKSAKSAKYINTANNTANKTKKKSVEAGVKKSVDKSYGKVAKIKTKQLSKRRIGPVTAHDLIRNKRSTMVIDSKHGKILFQDRAHERRYPASLVKVMTLYLVFEELSKKNLHMEQKIPISKYAASQQRTNINLKEGEYITVKNAIIAMIVKSANDASVALAEKIAGSERSFTLMMNMKARQLGMKDTHYMRATGLPHQNQYSTAYDLSILAMAIQRDFPKYFPLFATKNFYYKDVQYVSTHPLIRKHYPYVTGMKTGYIHDSGYNLMTSAEKSGKKIIIIALGSSSKDERIMRTTSILDKFLNDY